MERVENLIKLSMVPGLGCVSINRLLRHFGNSDAVLGASEAELSAVEGIGGKKANLVLQAANYDPRPELELAADNKVKVISYDDPAYPKILRETYDPPIMLYVKGELKHVDGVAFGVVGTRRASRYGREQAERFGGLLARAGFTVVSGLARGIDSFAHRGCLAAGGRTLAVVGCGLCHFYPEENRDLAAEIATSGAVISEFPMEMGPTRENFPRRNRIIAGLSLGTLVVEAPNRSGAMITARHAMEMNRDVFAIPGHVDQENTTGCHRLIRDGAALTRGIDDILEVVGVTAELAAKAAHAKAPTKPDETPVATAPTSSQLNDREQKIVGALSAEPMYVDTLCEMLNLPVNQVSATLMILEIKQKVKQLPGKFFIVK